MAETDSCRRKASAQAVLARGPVELCQELGCLQAQEPLVAHHTMNQLPVFCATQARSLDVQALEGVNTI